MNRSPEAPWQTKPIGFHRWAPMTTDEVEIIARSPNLQGRQRQPSASQQTAHQQVCGKYLAADWRRFTQRRLSTDGHRLSQMVWLPNMGAWIVLRCQRPPSGPRQQSHQNNLRRSAQICGKKTKPKLAQLLRVLHVKPAMTASPATAHILRSSSAAASSNSPSAPGAQASMMPGTKPVVEPRNRGAGTEMADKLM